MDNDGFNLCRMENPGAFQFLDYLEVAEMETVVEKDISV